MDFIVFILSLRLLSDKLLQNGIEFRVITLNTHS